MMQVQPSVRTASLFKLLLMIKEVYLQVWRQMGTRQVRMKLSWETVRQRISSYEIIICSCAELVLAMMLIQGMRYLLSTTDCVAFIQWWHLFESGVNYSTLC